MRKVTLIMSASIDGYVVKPDGMAIGAMSEPVELEHCKLDSIARAGTHILGRVFYIEMKDFWRNSQDSYAVPMGNIPKVVFSKTFKVSA